VVVGTEGAYGDSWADQGLDRAHRQASATTAGFDRNMGRGSKLGINRGINRLWTKGGIQYAPPIR
jgi:general L-amino acid transport system substrate-binding protein